MGQGEVGGVTRRVTCRCWLLCLAVKVPWFGPGGPILSRYLTTESADYCMLVDKWVQLRSRILLVMARSGLMFNFRVRAWTR